MPVPVKSGGESQALAPARPEDVHQGERDGHERRSPGGVRVPHDVRGLDGQGAFVQARREGGQDVGRDEAVGVHDDDCLAPPLREDPVEGEGEGVALASPLRVGPDEDGGACILRASGGRVGAVVRDDENTPQRGGVADLAQAAHRRCDSFLLVVRRDDDVEAQVRRAPSLRVQPEGEEREDEEVAGRERHGERRQRERNVESCDQHLPSPARHSTRRVPERRSAGV